MHFLATERDGVGGVTGFEVIPYALPFREPYTTARGTLRRREMVLLRVHTRSGIIGLGEAVPLSLRGGHSLQFVVDELRRLAREFAEASRSERNSILLDAWIESSPPSQNALSSAWLDIAGKINDKQAWMLEGAQTSEPVQCNATLTAGEPLQVAQEALAWADEGFCTFKLKLGLAHDLDQVAAVRQAVGPEAKLRIDANGVWGPSEAISKLSEMAEHGIELAEQPCSSLDELAEVRRKSEIPIAADESIANPGQADMAVELEACDLATLKLSKVGGSIRARMIAGVLPSYMSSALDGPVGIAAAAHTAQALYPSHEEQSDEPVDPRVAHGLATQRLFSETIASRECELRDGFLHIPDGPGLGVEIDDAALERHRL